MPNLKTFPRVQGVSGQRIQISKLVATNLGGGMDINTDSADLDPSQFTLLQNVTNLKDSIVTRDGSLEYVPAKPGSNPVLGFYTFAKEDGTVKLLRFTPSTIHLSQSSSWLAVTGASLTGGPNDRYTPVVANDRFFFANNGKDVIQEFLPSTNTVAVLGNAPKYKFITAFGDRIVGFNLAGASPNSVQVGWSGNLNYSVWDSITDQTAGFQPLVDSSSDLADPGTGIFGGSNTLVLVRERSIWEANLTGSPTQPFAFYTKIPGIGCDAPYSIQKIPGGIAFLDSRTRNVYVYNTPGGTIQAIGTPIRDQLLNSVADPTAVFSGYDTKKQEYIICVIIPNTTTVNCWKYNFIYQTWSLDTYENLTSMDILDYLSGTLDYADLIGSYANLMGTYASLGAAAVKQVTKFLGYNTGYLAYEAANQKYDAADRPPNNVFNHIMKAETKVFQLPSDDMYFAEFRIEFDMLLAGDVFFYYLADNIAKNMYVMQNLQAGQNILFKFKKQVKCRRIYFRFMCNSGLIKFKEYEVWVSQGADSRR